MLDDNLSDTASGFVYWQNPMPINEQLQTNKIRSGQLLDIKLGISKPESRPDLLNNANK
jgi:hypothetical protein